MTRSELHTADWDTQFGQLSAYADGELDPTSRAALEAHLPHCPRCQAALADLRAVKAVLGAMPAPALPRSFAIPEDEPLPLVSAGRAQAREARRGGTGAARLAQWLGGIAAAVGLTLLLGSALVHLPTPAPSAANAPGFGAAASRAPTATLAPTGSTTGSQSAQTPAQTSAEPDKSATPAPATPTPAAEREASSDNSSASASQPPVAPIAGATLLIAGGASFVAGRGAERRRRHANS